MRIALLRGLREHADRVGQGKRMTPVTTDDVMATCASMLSVFIREPEFQGQTKDKLATLEASRIVEATVRDAFDHWLAGRRSRRTGCSIG
jgi:topoisomerase-4 subunit B